MVFFRPMESHVGGNVHWLSVVEIRHVWSLDTSGEIHVSYGPTPMSEHSEGSLDGAFGSGSPSRPHG